MLQLFTTKGCENEVLGKQGTLKEGNEFDSHRPVLICSHATQGIH